MRRTIVIGHVITCACLKRKRRAVPMLDNQLTGYNENYMAFMTPVVSNIPTAIVNKADLDLSNLARTHGCCARLAREREYRKCRPICRANR